MSVSIVSAEYYRKHLADLSHWYAALILRDPGQEAAIVPRVQFAARCLMRSDCPDLDPFEFLTAQRLIDASAGYIARHNLQGAK